jgi:hypothetical protein
MDRRSEAYSLYVEAKRFSATKQMSHLLSDLLEES